MSVGDDRRLQVCVVMPSHSAMLKLYAYQGCSTCRNAVKWLKQHDIAFDEIAIRETPPSVAELRSALDACGGDLRRLFNTSGMDYRALGMKDKLPAMTTDAALKLLSTNGNLVKRPFAIDAAKKVHLVGFKADEWKAKLS
jgi:arsenate reductase (glutaredoxin)